MITDKFPTITVTETRPFIKYRFLTAFINHGMYFDTSEKHLVNFYSLSNEGSVA